MFAVKAINCFWVNFFFNSTLPLSPSATQVKGRLAKVNPYRSNLHVDDPPSTCLQDPPHSGEVQAVESRCGAVV
jgi:hypothetical protein